MRFNETVPFLPRALAVVMASGLAMTLALGTARGVTADSDGRGRGCSEATLRGDYGVSVDGQIVAGPRTGLFRAVGVTHYDGEGNLSHVDFATLNGIPIGSDWRPGTGTYQINPDCTGTAQIAFTDGSPALRLRLVVTDRGDVVRTTAEGTATGGVGSRVR